MGKNLPIFGVEGTELQQFLTRKADIKNGINIFPPEKYRLQDEDLF